MSADEKTGRAWVHDPGAGRWLAFEGREILVAKHPEQVRPTLDAVRRAVDDGQWAVGFLSYDAAPAVDQTLAARVSSDSAQRAAPPLTWWVVGPAPTEAVPAWLDTATSDAPESLLNWQPRLDQTKHQRAIEEIRRLIERGDTYQVNFTFALEAALDGRLPDQQAKALFSQLWRAQRAPYAAFIDAGRWAICSASPELFFSQDGDRLVARPMKGTSRRGRFPAEDLERLAELHTEKNRAENLMITDMTRNDLGRLARPGSVVVERLFAEETYSTVHQLTSQVRADTDADPMTVLETLFPCASITGAPKKRATEIIRDLEAEPRGLYTGAIGWIAPDRRAQFSVAIRTAVVDREQRRARYGVGGGIVWDSEPAAEYEECRAKALVLARPRPPFDLLETLRWQPRRGFVRLGGHLERLESSARYFGFRLDRAALERDLHRRAENLEAVRHRVRIRLGEDGDVQVDAAPWPCSGRETWRIVTDDRPVDERDARLFHKTTDRSIYDAAQDRHPEADEVLLWNRHGRLTEGARSNLVLRFGDRFLTPPLTDGLLPGVYRAALLARGRIEEAPLELDALERADAIFCVNSLRGWVRCQPFEADSSRSGASKSVVSKSVGPASGIASGSGDGARS